MTTKNKSSNPTNLQPINHLSTNSSNYKATTRHSTPLMAMMILMNEINFSPVIISIEQNLRIFEYFCVLFEDHGWDLTL